MADRRVLASRYMTRFACIGADCEDTCCSGANWHVLLTQEDHQRAQQATAADAQLSQRLIAAFRLLPGARPDAFAALASRADGTCALLDEDRLCALHRRCGDAPLPEVCSSYPRVVGRVGERLELSGAVSCPEVARQLLLTDDATDPVEVEPALLGRGKPLREMDAGEDPYLLDFRRVRAATLSLLSQPGYPIAGRLFFCAFLGDRLRAVYRRGAPGDAEAVGLILEELAKPPVLAALHEHFTAVEARGSIAPAVVLAIIEARLLEPCAPAFIRLCDEVARGYLEQAGLPVPERPIDGLRGVGLEAIWNGHQRRQEVPRAIERRIDRYFTNYSLNYLTHDWHLQRDDLLHHVQTLLARVALLRFLLFGRPGLAGERDPAAWDRAAVEVFYAVSRAIEHNIEQRNGIAQALERSQLLELPHAVSLLQF